MAKKKKKRRLLSDELNRISFIERATEHFDTMIEVYNGRNETELANEHKSKLRRLKAGDLKSTVGLKFLCDTISFEYCAETDRVRKRQLDMK